MEDAGLVWCELSVGECAQPGVLHRVDLSVAQGHPLGLYRPCLGREGQTIIVDDLILCPPLD